MVTFYICKSGNQSDLNNISRNIRFRPILGVGAFVVLAVTVIALLGAIRLTSIQAHLTGSLEPFYANPAYQTDLMLENFPIYKQAYANSCGPTTISMLYSYLVEPISEQGLADKLGVSLGKSGMLPTKFYNKLQSALEEAGYHVEHHVNVADSAFLEQIYLQLKQGIPVPIYFSTVNAWDKPNFDTHYSVIIGIRPQNRQVVIANAYGFLEEMLISDLLIAVKYNNFRNAPVDFRLGLFVGLINQNNLFVIQK